MDRKTQHILGKISDSIPSKLKNNLTKVVKDDHEEQLARMALESKDIPNDKKRQIERALKEGKFHREETVINERVASEIDKFNTARVAEARRSGALKDPMDDPFYRKRIERQKKGDFKPNPLTEAEKRKAAATLHEQMSRSKK
jgi:hypothetical protein